MATFLQSHLQKALEHKLASGDPADVDQSPKNAIIEALKRDDGDH